MNIDCYLSHGCGSEKDLRGNITRALAVEKVEAEVNSNVIDDEKAIALGLSGSPSLFVNGKEISRDNSNRIGEIGVGPSRKGCFEFCVLGFEFEISIRVTQNLALNTQNCIPGA